MSYVYLMSERPSAYSNGLWSVGYYDPSGKWNPASDHASEQEAADRVIELNGGGTQKTKSQVWGEALLYAAESALRSYQYGNASPELAKEVADKIRDHLRDSLPGQPA